ncbi:hypothetical protein ACFOEM_04420 [Paenalcaligenes hominis]|uniref:hypothetical protein n=1 Tax=Paenalcaligenes hominis TaxID=643674 RepID=UPI00361A92CD
MCLLSDFWFLVFWGISFRMATNHIYRAKDALDVNTWLGCGIHHFYNVRRYIYETRRAYWLFAPKGDIGFLS